MPAKRGYGYQSDWSRKFGKTRVAAGIVGHADMMLGSRVEPVLNALRAPLTVARETNEVGIWCAPSKCDSAGRMETEIGLMLGFRSISPSSSPLDPWR